jgi:hypothetical protein
MPRVKFGDHYFLKTNVHVINEILYFDIDDEIVLQQVVHGAIIEKKNLFLLSIFLVLAIQ